MNWDNWKFADSNKKEIIANKLHCVVWLRQKFVGSNSAWFESDIQGTHSHCLREGQDLADAFDFDVREA
ncbi:MAG: hypothetical protein CBB68_13245 [Rhodospirillaceae bacterium TMED8]|jgi:hypothetical protein|nr:MAG: hypothetical protein CBB68_13245 [Rhodospirillaceae bacterium TMED8]